MNKIESIFSEYVKEKPKIEVSVEQTKQELSSYESKIVLYGAGSAGIAFLYQLREIGINPIFFADANENKIGHICEEISIIAPSQILEKVGAEALVIVCINTDGKRYCKSFDEALRVGGHHAVYDNLRKFGCKNVIDYTYFRRCHALFCKEKYNAPSCSDVYLMEEHIDEISEVYEFLADDLSKEIFEKIVRFRLLDDSIDVPTIDQSKQYFEYGFYPKREDEIFVDCGAFNGISFRTFLKENANKFQKYYGIEPDEENFIQLQTFKKLLSNEIQQKMILFQGAAWDNDSGASLYELHGPGSFIADIGQKKIRTITIDALLQNQKATYIKMNIEGSEKEALKGAKNTIEAYKPKLAIAGYHRTDDLWKIPLQIKSYRSDYKLYLRSYMNHISFVYYGV